MGVMDDSPDSNHPVEDGGDSRVMQLGEVVDVERRSCLWRVATRAVPIGMPQNPAMTMDDQSLTYRLNTGGQADHP